MALSSTVERFLFLRQKTRERILEGEASADLTDLDLAVALTGAKVAAVITKAAITSQEIAEAEMAVAETEIAEAEIVGKYFYKSGV